MLCLKKLKFHKNNNLNNEYYLKKGDNIVIKETSLCWNHKLINIERFSKDKKNLFF